MPMKGTKKSSANSKLRQPVVIESLSEDDLVQLVALELYREGRFTMGECAEAIGISQSELPAVFRAHGVALNYGAEDARQDLATLKELHREGHL